MKYQVVVIGAGVAGASGAFRLAEKGMQVVVVDRGQPMRETDPRPEWVNPRVPVMLKEMQVETRDCIGEPFEGAAFHALEEDQVAVSKAEKPPAYRVDYAGLVRRLNETAAGLGIAHRHGEAPAGFEVGESQVTVAFSESEPVQADFVLRAGGAEHDPQGPWLAQAVAGFKKSAGDNLMHWMLSKKEANLEANWWFDGSRLIFQRFGVGAVEKAEQTLRDLLDRLTKSGSIPAKAVDKNFAVRIRPLPNRLALEMDSHVDKRGLIIGDAGGFVAAASQEGIYPAMWSSELAAHVIAQAADSPNSQDELRKFSSLWRTTMAEYLRRPNADAHFLLPLIFSNQQMANRMAAAFWHGKNI